MNKTFERRHSRWYELILFNSIFQFIAGYFFVVMIPAWLKWPYFPSWPMQAVEFNTALSNTVAFSLSYLALRRFRQFPGAGSLTLVTPTILVAWSLVFVALLFLREEAYSRPVLMYSLIAALFWSFTGALINKRYKKWKLAVVPFGRSLSLTDTPAVNITILDKPTLSGRRYDAVVADLQSEDLTSEWERFLASCALAHIPVFHIKPLQESLTGRVQIEHLSENIFGSLMPPKFYFGLKRILDLIMAFALLPFVLPVMLVIALRIRADSSGGALFIQQRMGYRGKIFKMYKFRSMYTELKGAGFTEDGDDPRITRVGKTLRKYRIDELPQIFNVIKGDMSFIGPRPESVELANWYERDVPFFNYRHVVRPGISGWAQVEQGYAAEVDGMKLKVAYDFYYIKHFSFWLDVLVLIKTIRVVIVGYGAR